MTFLKGRSKQFSALIPATALIFLDQTILPVALPSIQKQIQSTDTTLQWCVNAYLLAIAVFVLISGKLADRINHKKALMWGMFGFVTSSLLCGFSQTAWVLILGRALQGLSAALMYPTQITIVALVFPPEKRGRATGMIVSLGALFLVLGPLVGGYLIKVASWQWIFWINFPIGAIGLWMIYAFLPTSSPGKGKIDWIGFAFFALGISGLTTVFMQAADWGWSSPQTITCSLLTAAALLLLLYREKKAAHPFLDLSLFKHPVYSAININIATTQFFLMINIFRTLYFQEILGYSPFETGFIMFISSLPILVVAPLAGYLSDRFSPRLPIAYGYLLLIFSNFLFAFVSTPALFTLNIALLAFGMGIPLILTPSYSAAMASVPKGKAGSAGGMITTLRMTGGTVGLALIHLFVTTIQGKHELAEGKRLAQITGFSYVHFALAFLLIIAFAITFIFHSRKSAHHLPQSPAKGWD